MADEKEEKKQANFAAPWQKKKEGAMIIKKEINVRVCDRCGDELEIKGDYSICPVCNRDICPVCRDSIGVAKPDIAPNLVEMHYYCPEHLPAEDKI